MLWKAEACVWIAGRGGDVAQALRLRMEAVWILSGGKHGFAKERVDEMMSPLTTIRNRHNTIREENSTHLIIISAKP
jgi:hypothetical protein